ncbi:hypothetical protein ACHAQJ_009460 [Trichoderma viride]
MNGHDATTFHFRSGTTLAAGEENRQSLTCKTTLRVLGERHVLLDAILSALLTLSQVPLLTGCDTALFEMKVMETTRGNGRISVCGWSMDSR